MSLSLLIEYPGESRGSRGIGYALINCQRSGDGAATARKSVGMSCIERRYGPEFTAPC